MGEDEAVKAYLEHLSQYCAVASLLFSGCLPWPLPRKAVVVHRTVLSPLEPEPHELVPMRDVHAYTTHAYLDREHSNETNHNDRQPCQGK